jgi:hypothetical protein
VIEDDNEDEDELRGSEFHAGWRCRDSSGPERDRVT